MHELVRVKDLIPSYFGCKVTFKHISFSDTSQERYLRGIRTKCDFDGFIVILEDEADSNSQFELLFDPEEIVMISM